MKKVLIVAAWLIFAGCTKQGNTPEESSEIGRTSNVEFDPTTVLATVNYMGDKKYDGFGWVLSTGKTDFIIPTNLGEPYQVDGLNVFVTYKYTSERFPCRCTERPVMVEIISINMAD